MISEGWISNSVGMLCCVTCGYGMSKHYEDVVEERTLTSLTPVVVHSYFGCPDGAVRIRRSDAANLNKAVGMLQ